MNEYIVSFHRSAQKELEALPQEVISRVLPKIEELAVEPRPDGCKKLKGQEKSWRVRVGDYRVIYSVDDDSRNVEIINIRHRSQAYR
ncbi:type II toxin-antitoxin system RelE/ParE family toxin [Nostoc sp. T09]|uniref:type II toxin-antitoxin system RelE family toxin n=1 Tax=Nostoc sp. T09 TaxID=1932621 RepID=UPI000A3CB6DD|nr:type II toxin-antitoxin system RelE/ParE family toxin [Nostoc sp. T09]